MSRCQNVRGLVAGLMLAALLEERRCYPDGSERGDRFENIRRLRRHLGSGAIGGVVNVVDNRIPVELPPNPFSGEFDSRFDSGDLERSVAGQLEMALTSHCVLHLDGSFLRTDDRRIPAYALDDRVRRELTPEQGALDGFGGDPHGEVPNTGVETKDWAIGGSYVWDKGYIGASFNQFLSVYGIPDDPEVDEPGVSPSRVRLDVTKGQGNVRSSIVDPFPGFSTMNFKFVYTDYKHLEIDGDSRLDL